MPAFQPITREMIARSVPVNDMNMPNGYHQNTSVPHRPRQNDDVAMPRRVVQVAGVNGVLTTGAGVWSMAIVVVRERNEVSVVGQHANA